MKVRDIQIDPEQGSAMVKVRITHRVLIEKFAASEPTFLIWDPVDERYTLDHALTPRQMLRLAASVRVKQRDEERKQRDEEQKQRDEERKQRDEERKQRDRYIDQMTNWYVAQLSNEEREEWEQEERKRRREEWAREEWELKQEREQEREQMLLQEWEWQEHEADRIMWAEARAEWF